MLAQCQGFPAATFRPEVMARAVSVCLFPSVVAVFSRGMVSRRKCNGVFQMFLVFSCSQLLYFPYVISQVIIV